MLLGTKDNSPDSRANRFQSPERIHAFGNLIRAIIAGTPIRFNPQRGFMLLGTLLIISNDSSFKFQSPERIHAFGNAGSSSLVRNRAVSIPREDSCFWEPANIPITHVHVLSFNPQRGFMLLGTPISKSDHHARVSFQSPERIHAFGNAWHDLLYTRSQ